MAQNINIGGRLHSTATGNTVAGANEVYDDTLQLKQDVINGDFDSRIGALTSQNYVTVDSVGSLPSPGQIDTIYRVAGTDTYSEYGWNGSAYVLLATKTNNGVIDGGRADTVYTVGESIDCGGAASI